MAKAVAEKKTVRKYVRKDTKPIAFDGVTDVGGDFVEASGEELDLYSIDGIKSAVEGTIGILKSEHAKFAGSNHAVSQCVAGALWGALWAMKRQLANEHGIKVDIDG